MAPAIPLEAELKVFEEHRREWAGTSSGKFAVIQGDQVLGFYEEYEAAFKAGVKAFGLSRVFLVKQIWVEEPVYFVA